MSCGGPPEGLGKKKAAMERRVEAKVRGGQEGRPLSPSQCEERKVMGEVVTMQVRDSMVGGAATRHGVGEVAVGVTIIRASPRVESFEGI